MFVRTRCRVTTIDYNGHARTSGGDPVEARFVGGDKLSDPITDCDVHVQDNQNGTYDLVFR